LTFVPSRYLYPAQRGRLNRFTNVLGAVWSAVAVWLFALLPAEALTPASAVIPEVRHLALASLFFPIYYMAASWLVSLKLWRRKRRRSRDQQVEAALSS
jgi:hypothetical protein